MKNYHKSKFISVFSLKTNFKSRSLLTGTTANIAPGLTIIIPFCFAIIFGAYSYVFTSVLSPDSGVGTTYHCF